jgi:dephospho-CoA kinase
MYKLGIAGGIGSGKTTVTNIFAEQGITVVDADLVSRDVVEPGTPCLAEIMAHFGKQVLDKHGRLDRTALRHIIFSDEAEKKWLENLLHPAIRSEIINQLNTSDSAYTILSAPIFFETNQQVLVDRVAVVDVPISVQIERASQRDSSDADQIAKIVDQQIKREDRLARADDIIDNSGTIEATKEQVLALHKKYLDFANER